MILVTSRVLRLLVVLAYFIEIKGVHISGTVPSGRIPRFLTYLEAYGRVYVSASVYYLQCNSTNISCIRFLSEGLNFGKSRPSVMYRV